MLTICERHGQPPSWWRSLDHEDQAMLLAFYRYRIEEARKQ